MSGVTPISLAGLADHPLPRLGATVDKDRRGRVLVVGGGTLAPGAVVLAGVAALRAGAGKLQLAVGRRDAAILGLAVPEAGLVRVASRRDGAFKRRAAADLIAALHRIDALVVGPGTSNPERDGALATTLLANLPANASAVIDAAAMTGLDLTSDDFRAARGRLVLTPHAGEMARLTGCDRADVEADPLAAARALARRADAVVVMKGRETFIVTPDGRAWRHADGVPGLATSGSGDVLSGLIGGFLARGACPAVSALWGVCVHGGTGARLSQTIAPLGFLARDLLEVVTAVLGETAASHTPNSDPAQGRAAPGP